MQIWISYTYTLKYLRNFNLPSRKLLILVGGLSWCEPGDCLLSDALLLCLVSNAAYHVVSVTKQYLELLGWYRQGEMVWCFGGVWFNMEEILLLGREIRTISGSFQAEDSPPSLALGLPYIVECNTVDS